MIYFISGHRDIKREEFEEYYVPQLRATLLDKKAQYVVGDYYGVDMMAQEWLRDNLSNLSVVTVYHMWDKPKNLATPLFNLSGGYKSDVARDSAMTDTSDIDIAWIRKGKEFSGTAQNILRRKTMKMRP
jgi:hypothetical protein